MMTGRTGSYLIGRGDGLLVVAVEEVNLKALDAHIGIVFHHSIRYSDVTQRIAANQVTPTRPQDDAHALLFAIGYQALQVDFRVQRFHQRLLSAPSLVDDDILEMILGGKVDII